MSLIQVFHFIFSIGRCQNIKVLTQNFHFIFSVSRFHLTRSTEYFYAQWRFSITAPVCSGKLLKYNQAWDFNWLEIHRFLEVCCAGGCDRALKCGREELPHVQGQGQKPGGPHAGRAVTKRSYPTSEGRGSGLECHAATAQEWQRGATPGPRLGAAAGRSYPTPEARGGGREDQPHVQRAVAAQAQEGLRGAIRRWTSGRAVVRRYPSSEVRSNCCALLEQPWRDTPCPR